MTSLAFGCVSLWTGRGAGRGIAADHGHHGDRKHGRSKFRTHHRVSESRFKQEQLVLALQDQLRLAYLRYRGGVDTQFKALDADRDLFQPNWIWRRPS
jgi:hypothetical protein